MKRVVWVFTTLSISRLPVQTIKNKEIKKKLEVIYTHAQFKEVPFTYDRDTNPNCTPIKELIRNF